MERDTYLDIVDELVTRKLSTERKYKPPVDLPSPLPAPQREMWLIPLQPAESTKEMWNQSRGLAAREIRGLPIPSPYPGSLAGVPLDLRLSGTRA